MKASCWFPAWVFAAAAVLCGCSRFEFRLSEPAQYAGRLGPEPRVLLQHPLEYRLLSDRAHVLVRIGNPLETEVALVASQSYLVDPEGESHPIQGTVIGPHSHLRLELPPKPVRVTTYVDGFYSRWDWPLGPYGYPYWPGSGWPVWGPSVTTRSYDMPTPYGWNWKPGQVRLHLGYTCAGTNFAHELTIVRERLK